MVGVAVMRDERVHPVEAPVVLDEATAFHAELPKNELYGRPIAKASVVERLANATKANRERIIFHRWLSIDRNNKTKVGKITEC